MPLYEYYCHQCEEGFEVVRSHGDGADCPKCHSTAERRFSTFSFRFSNPFPVRGNIAGDGEGFTRKIISHKEV
ncbi:hypothetical protein LCGC14_0420750 [marine sediment metagenome]|uniref:Putative regulatory protein FmdB zinc ribbon domain-containing protein n=1 Tax=marine sediment metagenome TaxID=412755 RepID=A0A0F9VD55_9ZZZZ